MENLNLVPPGPKGPFSENWLVEAILVTILCGCGMPFGVAGIVFAAQVNAKLAAGDQDGAEKARKEAAKWTKIGFFVGIGCIILYILFWLVLGIGFFGVATSIDR
jgi:hypothetical protein